MSYFMKIIVYVIIGCFLIWSYSTRPSSLLFARKHPFITISWLATSLFLTTIIIFKQRNAFEAEGVLILIGFFMLEGATIMQIEQKWNTTNRIPSLLLGMSIMAFIGMVLFSMLV